MFYPVATLVLGQAVLAGSFDIAVKIEATTPLTILVHIYYTLGNAALVQHTNRCT